MLSHELGHAADFSYPGCWVVLDPRTDRRRALWLGWREDRDARRWRRMWYERDDDEVEWAADAIAQAVTGIPVTYCGRCMLQCFSGIPRPSGLR